VERFVLIYGSQVALELTSVLAATPAVRTAVMECSCKTLTENELESVAKYLCSTYMNMRARDFVRQLVGKTRKSLAQGTRPTLGVIASGLGGERKVKTDKKPCVCYFCGISGHRVPDCPEAALPPTNGIACRTIDFLGQDSYDWYWCVKCERWRTHKSAFHQSLEAPQVEQSVLDDSDDDSLVGEVEELIEMENVIGDD
jgi:hypothetical protein